MIEFRPINCTLLARADHGQIENLPQLRPSEPITLMEKLIVGDNMSHAACRFRQMDLQVSKRARPRSGGEPGSWKDFGASAVKEEIGVQLHSAAPFAVMQHRQVMMRRQQCYSIRIFAESNSAQGFHRINR